MTLVLTINGPDTIWMLTDRRISYGDRPPRDDGCKTMRLQTKDGSALLGYAGLGETVGGTEPAEWMRAVLRGQNLSLEQSLGVLSAALQRQFPRHLLALPRKFGASHSILVPAFLNDEIRLYSIDLAFSPDRSTYSFRYARHVRGPVPSDPPRTHRISFAGSGQSFLLRDKKWMEELRKLVRLCDRLKIGPEVVADYLARLNSRVSRGMVDNSVGPRSIVLWKHKTGSARKGGASQQFYTGDARDSHSLVVPAIDQGWDIKGVLDATMPITIAQMKAWKNGGVIPDNTDEINAALAKLPDKPDETLR